MRTLQATCHVMARYDDATATRITADEHLFIKPTRKLSQIKVKVSRRRFSQLSSLKVNKQTDLILPDDRKMQLITVAFCDVHSIKSAYSAGIEDRILIDQ